MNDGCASIPRHVNRGTSDPVFAAAKIGAILGTANMALNASTVTIRGVHEAEYVDVLIEIGAMRGRPPDLKL